MADRALGNPLGNPLGLARVPSLSGKSARPHVISAPATTIKNVCDAGANSFAVQTNHSAVHFIVDNVPSFFLTGRKAIAAGAGVVCSIGSANATIYAHDSRTGAALWALKNYTRTPSGVAHVDAKGRCYFIVADAIFQYIIAVDKSGVNLWQLYNPLTFATTTDMVTTADCSKLYLLSSYTWSGRVHSILSLYDITGASPTHVRSVRLDSRPANTLKTYNIGIDSSGNVHAATSYDGTSYSRTFNSELTVAYGYISYKASSTNNLARIIVGPKFSALWAGAYQEGGLVAYSMDSGGVRQTLYSAKAGGTLNAPAILVPYFVGDELYTVCGGDLIMEDRSASQLIIDYGYRSLGVTTSTGTASITSTYVPIINSWADIPLTAMSLVDAAKPESSSGGIYRTPSGALQLVR